VNNAYKPIKDFLKKIMKILKKIGHRGFND
ncbi:unnamed protein product, partial [marine sediment metagenome]